MIKLFFILLISCSESSIETLKGKTMGTSYLIKVQRKDKSANLKNGIDEIFLNINKQMSTYLADSEITRFNNHRSTEPFKISDDFLFVLTESKKIFELTNGAFDPSVMPLVNLWGFGPKEISDPPSTKDLEKTLTFVGLSKLIIGQLKIQKRHPFLELDLSAIAKGYAIDKVVNYLDLHSENFLIELGGEVFARGFKDESKKLAWKIGIEKPLKDNRQAKEVLALRDECVATSGDYRNFKENSNNESYSHLIDLKTGKSKDNDYVSVSVVAPNCLYADALATAFLASGKIIEIDKIKSIVIKRSDL